MQRRLVVGSLVLVSLALAHTPEMTAAQAPATKSASAAQPKAPAAAKPAGAVSMPRMAITTVRIKPELVDEWMEFQKSETIPALRKAGVSDRTAIATAIGESFEMTFLTPLRNFAERDGDSPIVKALGADGARDVHGEESALHHGATLICEHGAHRLELPTGIERGRASRNRRREHVLAQPPGHVADFEAYIKTDLTPAHKQLKTGGFIVHQALFGGDAGTFVVAALLPNFAALDKGPAIVRAYGQARADAIQPEARGLRDAHRTDGRAVVPELSFQAARPMTDHP